MREGSTGDYTELASRARHKFVPPPSMFASRIVVAETAPVPALLIGVSQFQQCSFNELRCSTLRSDPFAEVRGRDYSGRLSNIQMAGDARAGIGKVAAEGGSR